ncbi:MULTISPECIES: hypothetical protein [Parachlamydia]|jgi:nitrogen fixation/metabolism regulation signal transduction histidine kinase|uniref:Uncharacterized protein n=2 Tax=Parachlamydia acanthamoebae TaxID=83552 RepID=F8L144_PARAV|nr:hypothetical protein [Parachlamydia acanthamoebae]EFB42566.1 hypothetical protein pah_c004o059 [Parachlamydia acanthamoebae str. Hall's coccus]KIA77318.1 hypothetical protein DB43_GM00030 [Parachlamydia acanthamoebae]CCB86963.1 putative uncharacterized protein [Parachlamydia acanthamoebae UV-7]
MSDMRKRKNTSSGQAEMKYEKTVEEVANAVADSMKDDYQNDLEPFELYAERIKAKIHSEMDDFRERLAKGYQVLLDEVKKQ